MKRDGDIDLDELDELPDVVLGEKTRALRVKREGGTIRLQESMEENMEDTDMEKEMPEDFQFTRSLDARRIAEEMKKQEEAEAKQAKTVDVDNVPLMEEGKTEIISTIVKELNKENKIVLLTSNVAEARRNITDRIKGEKELTLTKKQFRNLLSIPINFLKSSQILKL